MNYNKTILVSGIESNTGKITLLEQEEGKQYPVKYSFFMNTTNGTPTETFTQFTQLGVSIGNSYQILVRDVAATNKMSGKPVTYRNIVSFLDSGVKTPPGSVPAPRAYAAAQKSVANTVSDNINRYEAKKEDSFRFQAIRRDATLITVAEMGQGGAWTPEMIKEHLEGWRKYYAKFYEDTPFIS
jgi:hypothetical protein